jgi:Mrp family chromosome partitioning ATPase
VTLLEKERETHLAEESELHLRMRTAASELEITTPAAPSLFAMNDRTKKILMGAMLPLLAGFTLLIGSSMASKTWRAEVMADRLGLPILAEDARGKGTLRADEARGLSLRIRQFVPESGAAVLVSSLNEGGGVDHLVTELARYFAMRNEHVLILDSRIAQSQAGELAALIDKRVDGSAPAVVPHASANNAAGPGMPGLVQYLVFEGQDPKRFMFHTRLPGVDYLPAGGPYPVTDALASEPMDELLEGLRQEYTLLLLVGPAVTWDVDTEILAAYVDGMIVVLNNPLGTFSADLEGFFRSLKEKNAPLLGSVICV